jgi:hypothetical protein
MQVLAGTPEVTSWESFGQASEKLKDEVRTKVADCGGWAWLAGAPVDLSLCTLNCKGWQPSEVTQPWAAPAW